MGRKHILWLFLGILFWGAFPISVAGIFMNKSFFQLAEIMLFFVLFTAFVTFTIHYYMGGFEGRAPQKWFFYPIMCWIFFGLFQLLDIGSTEDWIVIDIIDKIIG